MRELFKPVEATVNGQPVKTTQYQLFVQQLIKAGITGNTPARKLVLEFMRDHEVREKMFADEIATQKAGGLLQLDWDAEEESIMQAAVAKLNAVRKP